MEWGQETDSQVPEGVHVTDVTRNSRKALVPCVSWQHAPPVLEKVICWIHFVTVLSKHFIF